MIHTIERLTVSKHYRGCLKPELFTVLQGECASLLPAFKAVYAARAVARRPLLEPVDDISRDVHAVHQWLLRPSSALRSVISLFSAGGLFHVALCHEKGARAWLSAGGGTEGDMNASVHA